MTTCSNCRNQNAFGATFCGRCGARLPIETTRARLNPVIAAIAGSLAVGAVIAVGIAVFAGSNDAPRAAAGGTAPTPSPVIAAAVVTSTRSASSSPTPQPLVQPTAPAPPEPTQAPQAAPTAAPAPPTAPPPPPPTNTPVPPPPPTATPPISSGREALTPGWDIFAVALTSGSVTWTASPGSLTVVYQLTGSLPNGTYTGGAHFFPTNLAQCPFVSNFGAGINPGNTCAGSREGVTASSDGWDFGVMHTDGNGSATVQFNLSPRPGTYRTQFTIRYGNPCPPNCGVVYRTGGKFASSFTVITIP